METEINYINNNNNIDIYQQAIKAGLFNTCIKNDIKMKHNTMIPLVRVNQFFFGSNLFSNKLNYFDLHRDNMIKKEMGIYWVLISKLENYLNHINQILELEQTLNCCPYNYYKIIGNKQAIPEHYQLMINSIDKFLEFLDDKNTRESKTIRHIISPYSSNKIETEVVDFIDFNSNKSNELLLKFNKKGKPLFIRMTINNQSINSNFENKLGMYKDIQTSELENLYQYICQLMLLDTPEEFLITNIERVCGSREFAEIMVKSYLSKLEFKFNIDSISAIILWKNSEKENKYKNYFCEKYELCYQVIEGEIYINFEGINKFLLNISEDDVENFNVKEQINEMYYNSMHEMIYCFELLYKQK